MANPRKRSLSKNLSQMKFMKRQSLGKQDEDVDSGGILTEKWIVPDAPPPAKRSAGGKTIESFVECEGLDTFGRFSFNGFNKDVERLSRLHARGSPPVMEPEEDADIPAEEVARRYQIISLQKDKKRHRQKHFDKCIERKWSSEGGKEDSRGF